MRIMPASYWLYVNNIKAMKWIKIISKQKLWVRNWDDFLFVILMIRSFTTYVWKRMGVGSPKNIDFLSKLIW